MNIPRRWYLYIDGSDNENIEGAVETAFSSVEGLDRGVEIIIINNKPDVKFEENNIDMKEWPLGLNYLTSNISNIDNFIDRIRHSMIIGLNLTTTIKRDFIFGYITRHGFSEDMFPLGGSSIDEIISIIRTWSYD